ncbi:thiamine-phosphate kinase [Bacteroides pyogenes]|uniref:Thiamine-monophosphate kinase n=3 Tax=Bacteroides pyogenes TaxID=310300 RepID=A0A5D3EB47_9BACE|nr:thiamine-phosphate kinase [Bacteroides pyogenes]GAE16018.1 thiamine-monophosphate kinase [Bacteroides pyogenes JCM 6292]MBR8709195.1 Thiamine-monophosphate kinase [Bacteroides pyogenes]MBR8717991.1 Thiamine-monophosphate kinase [Bacteroides pyogenes]MBR8747495.1 Thiamine-monophosphate kinase [Bacteroides pyogenes]MBR8757841.1 Thiamine-monophosphate kinase [Bacteroides pyogenes]
MRTEISTLGEFGLIAHLTKGIKLENESSKYGIGDDAAVLSYPSEKQILVTTDLLMEGVHFDLTYVPLKHLGYKSAVVNFSDIYAMNGTPRQITISLALSKRFCVEDIEEFYAGVRLACQQYHVDIVGGDTSSSLTGLAISITCIGEADKNKVVYRNGAKETDLICVSGDLGAAYMGLQLLEREKTVLKGEKDIQPDFSGKEYLLERQLKPEARKDIIEKLAAANIIPSSMMDISDGLSSELLHICKQSNAGCRIYEEHIPIDYQTAVMAEEFNMNLTTCAMNGGEDYELVFTVSIADYDKVSQIEGIRLIGHITKPELGCALVTRDGQEFELRAQGWNALRKK